VGTGGLSGPTAAVTRVAVVGAAIGLVGVLGYATGYSVLYAFLGAVLILGAGLVSADLTLLPVLAFPSMLLLVRVGNGSGLAASDAILFLAMLCAIFQLRTRESPELRTLLWLVLIYQAFLLPTVLHRANRAGPTEWFHEAVLVGGSLVVGWVVGSKGRARQALSWYVVVCCGLAIAAAVMAPVQHFQPVYLQVSSLLTFQKNALGDLLAFAAIVVYARPSWLGWTAKWANAALVCCLVGMLATQSKQAMVGTAVGIVVIIVRGRVTGRRSKMILFLIVPMVVLAYVVASNQIASSNRFNAAHQRFTWYSQSIDLWQQSKWLGTGLRWWYDPQMTVHFQPPNVELEMLTSAGLVGLAGFLITYLAAMSVTWRMNPLYGSLALACLAARLVQGQFDLFWVASQSSIPWLIVGAALGAQSFDGRAPAAEPAAEPAPGQAGRRDQPSRARPTSTLAPSVPSGP
jgi:polysaccharide biosynthesis protein PslJ